MDPVFATDDNFGGLSAELEAALGTSDSDPDTDGDNVGDQSPRKNKFGRCVASVR